MDLNVPFSLTFAVGTSISVVANLGLLVVITWQVLFIALPTVYLAFRLQVMLVILYYTSFFFFFLTQWLWLLIRLHLQSQFTYFVRQENCHFIVELII